MNNIKTQAGVAKPVRALLLAVVLLLVTAVAPAQAGASTYKENYRFPVEWWAWVECADEGAGEAVYLTGTFHVVSHTTLDNRGGFHSKFQVHSQKFQGVGLSTGDKYQGKYMFQDHFNGKVGFTYTFKDKFKLTGQGPGNNLFFSYHFHITVNANGEVTAYVDNFRYSCK